VKRSRLKPATRKADILAAALRVATTQGFQNITQSTVAVEAGIVAGLIYHYYSTMGKLRRAVMRAAVHNEVLPIIAYGVIVKDRQALKAPKRIRDKAIYSTTWGDT